MVHLEPFIGIGLAWAALAFVGYCVLSTVGVI